MAVATDIEAGITKMVRLSVAKFSVNGQVIMNIYFGCPWQKSVLRKCPPQVIMVVIPCWLYTHVAKQLTASVFVKFAVNSAISTRSF